VRFIALGILLSLSLSFKLVNNRISPPLLARLLETRPRARLDRFPPVDDTPKLTVCALESLARGLRGVVIDSEVLFFLSVFSTRADVRLHRIGRRRRKAQEIHAEYRADTQSQETSLLALVEGGVLGAGLGRGCGVAGEHN